MRPLVADTCFLIWLTEAQRLSQAAQAALAEATDSGRPIFVSPISAWEIGVLAARRRIALNQTPEQWFERLVRLPGLQLATMPPRVLIASSFLPGEPPRDPADRIIAATARDLDGTLLTRDKRLLAFAGEGHLRAIAC